jgi:hypothetical protein
MEGHPCENNVLDPYMRLDIACTNLDMARNLDREKTRAKILADQTVLMLEDALLTAKAEAQRRDIESRRAAELVGRWRGVIRDETIAWGNDSELPERFQLAKFLLSTDDQSDNENSTQSDDEDDDNSSNGMELGI